MTTPWAGCPRAHDTEGRVDEPDRLTRIPCPTCASHHAAVEREVAAAVGERSKVERAAARLILNEEVGALTAEVARLTAHAKELRELAALAVKEWDEYGFNEDLKKPMVNLFMHLRDTPAGSDEPLRPHHQMHYDKMGMAGWCEAGDFLAKADEIERGEGDSQINKEDRT